MPDKIIDPDTLQKDQYVKFTCRHPNDQQTYEGKIVGIVNYDIAKNIEGDLIPYYREVAKIITNLAPYSTLNYLILQYSSSTDSAPLTVVRATAWIDPASIVIFDPNATFDIRIYDRKQDMDAQAVLNLLKSHGYTCSLVE